jgi:hypothetical protein
MIITHHIKVKVWRTSIVSHKLVEKYALFSSKTIDTRVLNPLKLLVLDSFICLHAVSPPKEHGIKAHLIE